MSLSTTTSPAVIDNPGTMQIWSQEQRAAGKRLAVVPTMGALHDGHLALVRQAATLADLVVVTIFVNPTQFGPGEDFERYPRTFEADLAAAAGAGAHVVFAPSATAMYPEGFQTFVDVEEVTRTLEGAMRPGHFRGVATVVAKLLNCTRPHVALFGQKDAQQIIVVRRMVRDLNIDVSIVAVPTVREADGLAKSSRNVYLTPAQRGEAPVLYRALQHAERMLGEGEQSADRIRSGVRRMIAAASTATIDYVSVANAETLEELISVSPETPVLVSLAVRFGSTRLIDNIHVTGVSA